jgi:hypothetical protein
MASWERKRNGRTIGAGAPSRNTWMFIYPNNPRTALYNAMKFRLAPMIPGVLGHTPGQWVP